MERSVQAPSESIFRAALVKHAIPLVAATGMSLSFWFLAFLLSRTAASQLVPPAVVRCGTNGHCWIDVFVIGAVFLVGGSLTAVVVAIKARIPWGLLMLMAVSPLHALVGIWYWEGLTSLFFDIPARTTAWHRRAALIALGGVASLVIHVLAFLMAMAVVTVFVFFLPEPIQGLAWSTVTCTMGEAKLVLEIAATGCAELVVKAAVLSEALALLLLIGGVSFVVDIALGLRHLIRVIVTVAGIEKADLNEGIAGNAIAANLVHISDLHVVASEDARRCESPLVGPRGNAHLRGRLAQLAPALQAADATIVSGDLTDTGSHPEWRAFLALMDDLPARVRERLFIIPGNHDLNFIERDDLLVRERRADTETFTGRHLRMCLFTLVMAKIQCDRCEVAQFDSSDKVHLVPMIDVLGPHLAAIQRSVDEIEQGKDASPSDFDVMNLFPMVWRTTSRSGTKLAFIGVNTCGVGTTIVNNAMGQFAWEKLSAVVKEVARNGYYPVVVGHHHMLPLFESRRDGVLAVRESERPPLGQRIKGVVSLVFMVAKDGVQAYRAFRSAAAATGFTYLHGHRHVTRFLTEQITPAASCHIAGAPSLLFGDEFTRDHRSAAMGLTLLQMQGDDSGIPSHRMIGGVAILQ